MIYYRMYFLLELILLELFQGSCSSWSRVNSLFHDTFSYRKTYLMKGVMRQCIHSTTVIRLLHAEILITKILESLCFQVIIYSVTTPIVLFIQTERMIMSPSETFDLQNCFIS